jgi:hypothetical protein
VVKRYRQEAGSTQARELLCHHRFVSCAIVPVEALSAFSRRKAAGALSERALRVIVAD